MRRITDQDLRDVEKRLHQIQDIITRNDMRNMPSYTSLFSITRLLEQAQSFVFLNPCILEHLTTTINMFFNSCAFDERPRFDTSESKSFRGGEFRKFLYDFYKVDYNEPLGSVLQSWRFGSFGNKREIDFYKDNIFSTVYFNILKESVEKSVRNNFDFLQSMIEIGQSDFRKLLSFLIQREIPFSGPYRRDSFGEAKLQLFLSSFDEVENVANRGKPMFGIFEFPLHSLQILPADAKNYVKSLQEMPFWIRHIPPAFNKPIETLRTYVV